MKKLFAWLAVSMGATGLGLFAQEPARTERPRPLAVPASAVDTAPATSAVARGDDEKAIQQLLDAFIKAFNAGNAEATAATYSDTAVVVDEAGERLEGRAAIRSKYAASFADNPKSTIKINVEALRFVGPETALELGKATITPAASAGAPETTRFTTVYVKQGGQWLQGAVRDEHAHDITPHERLKELEWLVGEWVNESQDSVVDTTCTWAKGGNFLDREFTVKVEGRPVLSGTQRIGWDPLRRQFKMWVFDSEGGHGAGYLTHTGDQWVIKSEGVRQDGQPASATSVITRLGKDRMSWQTTAMTLGGSTVPGIDEFVVVRKPPAVGR